MSEPTPTPQDMFASIVTASALQRLMVDARMTIVQAAKWLDTHNNEIRTTPRSLIGTPRVAEVFAEIRRLAAAAKADE